MESVSAAAASIWEALSALRPILPPDLRFSIPKSARERIAVYSAGPIEKALVTSGPKRASEVVPGLTTHRVTLFGARNKLDAARLAVGVSMRPDAKSAARKGSLPCPGVTLELSFDSALPGERDAAALAEGLLGALIRSFSLDAARATPGAVLEEAPSSSHVRVGWLTFLPHRLGPVPELPPAVTCVALDETGWLIRGCPAIPAPKETAYQEALAHLRHVLGARVLLDGPAMAPPPKVPVATPEPPPPDFAPPPLVPPPFVPSYLKATPPAVPRLPVFEADPARLPAPSASLVGAQLTAETSEIDISKLLRSSLPFSASAQPPSAGAPPRSTSGRWIRFNPQTGEPLAEPFWQELAATDAPSEPPRTERASTGTIDVDPEMVARILSTRPRT